jgi:hypothetical protein
MIVATPDCKGIESIRMVVSPETPLRGVASLLNLACLAISRSVSAQSERNPGHSIFYGWSQKRR